MSSPKFAREVLDDLPTQRLQENTAKAFSKMENALFEGCVGGTPSDEGNLSFKIEHSLGKEPKGYVITEQATASSIKSSLAQSTGTFVVIKFESSPGAFKVFLY
jgi:hypothetical protein